MPGPKVPHGQLLNYKANTIHHTNSFKINIELRGKNKRKKKLIIGLHDRSLLHSFHLLVPLCGIQGKFFFFNFVFRIRA